MCKWYNHHVNLDSVSLSVPASYTKCEKNCVVSILIHLLAPLLIYNQSGDLEMVPACVPRLSKAIFSSKSEVTALKLFLNVLVNGPVKSAFKFF